MTRFEELLHQQEPPERPAAKPDLPSGWEPGVRWSNETDSGSIVTDDMTGEPDQAIWTELIHDWGLDPEALEIVDGSIELIGWDGQRPEDKGRVRLKRYKARLRRRRRAGDPADIGSLCRLVEQRSPIDVLPIPPGGAERALVVCLSDWQLGKGEGGGSEASVGRILAAFDALERHLADLELLGRSPDAIYVVGLGDLVEQCSGNYPAQEFTTDLNRRQQMRLARRLLLDLVDRLVEQQVPVVLSAVAGNHGENRKDGKAYTTPDDNDDLAVFEQVGDVLRANPERYSGVSLTLPTRLSMTLDIAGVPVGFTHGHVARGGSHAAQRIQTWWEGQVMGNQPVADAQILVTAHYHHLIVSESSGRTHFQCPAMDGGSEWHTQSTGQGSPAGMLVFTVGAGLGARSWSDLEVLR